MLYPSIPPGEVPREWLEARAATRAELSGHYCAVTASQTVAALYPKFIGTALSLGLADFDAAALKDARPRQLTQAISAWLYETTSVDGVTFASRHGDDLRLWAVFERPEDPAVSPKLAQTQMVDLRYDAAVIKEAFEILDLAWAED